jgi:hypothetical protein
MYDVYHIILNILVWSNIEILNGVGNILLKGVVYLLMKFDEIFVSEVLFFI